MNFGENGPYGFSVSNLPLRICLIRSLNNTARSPSLERMTRSPGRVLQRYAMVSSASIPSWLTAITPPTPRNALTISSLRRLNSS